MLPVELREVQLQPQVETKRVKPTNPLVVPVPVELEALAQTQVPPVRVEFREPQRRPQLQHRAQPQRRPLLQHRAQPQRRPQLLDPRLADQEGHLQEGHLPEDHLQEGPRLQDGTPTRQPLFLAGRLQDLQIL